MLLTGVQIDRIGGPTGVISTAPALTIPKPVNEVPIMAASQPTCALPVFPDIDGIRFAHVPGWPGYATTDDGHAWSCHTLQRDEKGRILASYGEWRRLSEQLSDHGYYVVYLKRDGKRRRARVHILVLESFRGPCPPGMEACHDPDRTRTNNRLSNLRWDTRKSNHADKIKHGTSNRGERHGNSKLTKEKVLRIVSSEMDSASNSEVAAIMGVSAGAVASVRSGKVWSHLTGIDPATRQKRSTVVRGSKNRRSKLNEKQVIEIISAADCGEPVSDLAARYGVSGTIIYGIVNGKTWRHVARPTSAAKVERRKRPQPKRPGCHRGERNVKAKLSAEQVVQLRYDYRSGRFSRQSLCEKYGIKKSQFYNIVSGRQWGHV